MGIHLSKYNNGFDEELLEGHGLYHIPQNYDKKKVRKLIITKKLAPFYKGLEGLENEKMTRNQDDHMTGDNDVIECPICFLSYPSNINCTKCCDQPICTECFVQFKRSDPTLPVSCPFCVQDHFGVIYQQSSSILSNYHDQNTKQQRRMSMFQINPISCISKDTIATANLEQRCTSLPPMNQQNELSSSSPTLLSSIKKKKEFIIKKKKGKQEEKNNHMIIYVDDIRPLSSYVSSITTSRPTSSYILTTDITMNTPHFEDWMVLEAVRRSLQDQQQQQRNNSILHHSTILC
ncbi:hypothetical protein BJ944DRAFT_251431 [Cunninghamella echinulata]|nr:hypothetical protein BJ944DRAFT_251431 [Cunninghamella echinulata]